MLQAPSTSMSFSWAASSSVPPTLAFTVLLNAPSSLLNVILTFSNWPAKYLSSTPAGILSALALWMRETKSSQCRIHNYLVYENDRKVKLTTRLREDNHNVHNNPFSVWLSNLIIQVNPNPEKRDPDLKLKHKLLDIVRIVWWPWSHSGSKNTRWLILALIK